MILNDSRIPPAVERDGNDLRPQNSHDAKKHRPYPWHVEQVMNNDAIDNSLHGPWHQTEL